MNLEQWLRLRREGRLAAMPLGMDMSMAACGDCLAVLIGRYDESNGQGDGHGHMNGNGDGNGEGYKNGSGDGYGYPNVAMCSIDDSDQEESSGYIIQKNKGE